MTDLEHTGPTAREWHLAHFYNSSSDLAGAVAAFLNDGLLHGETAVAITTPEHRAAIEPMLVGSVDGGRVVWMDADRMLPRILTDGRLNIAGFEQEVARRVRAAAARAHGFRAYGELVDLLWRKGSVEQAIALENVWNELIDELGFPLLCGYGPADPAVGPELMDEAHRIHALVSTGVAEPPLPPAVASRRFPAKNSTPAEARRFLERIAGRRAPAALDTARLVLSELVTNAVLHGGGPIGVTVRVDDTTIRVVIQDTSRDEPVVQGIDHALTSGRGLQLVGRLSREWGWQPIAEGKIVWAELDA